MALNPQRIRETSFRAAKRGYEQAEVDAFLTEVAAALEAAQNEATAMEARARAAVARLQELSQAAPPDQPAEGAAPAAEPVRASVDEAETISRALLLAQRTADTTVAEAQVEADRVLAAARDEAAASLDAARAEAAGIVEQARAEARHAGETERVQVAGEVQALLARRDFLESDVDHLEQYLLAQRERITEAVAELSNLVQRVPGGLGDMRRPLLSAAADEPAAADAPDGDDDQLTAITAVAGGDVDVDGDRDGDTGGETGVADGSAERDVARGTEADEASDGADAGSTGGGLPAPAGTARDVGEPWAPDRG